jgi:hypothetical protein
MRQSQIVATIVAICVADESTKSVSFLMLSRHSPTIGLLYYTSRLPISGQSLIVAVATKTATTYVNDVCIFSLLGCGLVCECECEQEGQTSESATCLLQYSTYEYYLRGVRSCEFALSMYLLLARSATRPAIGRSKMERRVLAS